MKVCEHENLDTFILKPHDDSNYFCCCCKIDLLMSCFLKAMLEGLGNVVSWLLPNVKSLFSVIKSVVRVLVTYVLL